MSEQELLEFCSKDCKNNSHNICIGHWVGLGFKVQCNCECHKKSVLGRDESLPNTLNLTSERRCYHAYYHQT